MLMFNTIMNIIQTLFIIIGFGSIFVDIVKNIIKVGK